MQWSGCYASRLFSRVPPSSCLMFLMHKEGHKPSYTSFILGPICGWKKNFKMCRSQRSLVVIVMMKIFSEEKDILISDPISGGTDPDHCICLPSLTAIIILFHNNMLTMLIMMIIMMLIMEIIIITKMLMMLMLIKMIRGRTDPDHCICLPSLTAIIILFHNAALSYSELIINHTLIIKNGLINESQGDHHREL